MPCDKTALTLRPESLQDRPFLEGLYRSTRDDLLQLGLPDAMTNNLIQMQFKAQQAGYRNQYPDAEYSIIEKNDEPIGYLIAHRGDESIRLVYIALMPHESNKGQGCHLIQALQNEALDSNKTLALTVDPLNFHAKHVYLSAGFQVVSKNGTDIEMVWQEGRPPIHPEKQAASV